MLYTAFAEAESSFTILDYHGSKKRKDILLPLFSRKAIVDMQGLIQDCVSLPGARTAPVLIATAPGRSNV